MHINFDLLIVIDCFDGEYSTAMRNVNGSIKNNSVFISKYTG